MTNQLIPVFNGTINSQSVLLCNARELHVFLGVGKRFASWITERIYEYEFVENQDYIIISQNRELIGRGRPTKDYHLTLDTAKELAMVERNEKGRQARRYFIECEKQLLQHYQHPVVTPRRTAEPLTRSDMKNLNYLVVMMTRQFSRTGSWRLGVWHALRRATGVPSPELFTVDDLPALTQECRRIIQITSEAGDMIGRIEQEAVRRIVRNREDCDMVLAELQRECNNQRISDAGMRQLERHEQIALRRLEQRVIA